MQLRRMFSAPAIPIPSSAASAGPTLRHDSQVPQEPTSFTVSGGDGDQEDTYLEHRVVDNIAESPKLVGHCVLPVLCENKNKNKIVSTTRPVRCL